MPDPSRRRTSEIERTPPGRLPKGQCTTGKLVYYRERLANRAITEAAKRGELDQLRHYPCPECGWWHLSRKRSATLRQQ